MGNNFLKYKDTTREDQVNQINDTLLETVIDKIERGEMGDLLKEDLPYLKFRLKRKRNDEE